VCHQPAKGFTIHVADINAAPDAQVQAADPAWFSRSFAALPQRCDAEHPGVQATALICALNGKQIYYRSLIERESLSPSSCPVPIKQLLQFFGGDGAGFSFHHG